MLTDEPMLRGAGRLWLSGALILSAVLACRPASVPEDLVAVSELGEVRRPELEQFILSLPEARRSPPAEMTLAEWRRQILEELITGQALEEEARSLGLAATEDGAARLADARDLVLIQAVETRLLGEKVEVTEEDLQAFYDAHPEDFSHPEQIRVRNIYKRVARDAAPEVWESSRQEIEDLLAQIQRGARFGDLAREHSDSETAPLEGLIGRVDRGKLDPALEDILWSLDEGEVSDVLRTPVGFHLFKVENRLGRFKMDFEDARTRLRRRLTREATEAAGVEILEELREASGATYDPEALSGGARDDVLFELDGKTLTVADFYARLDRLGFYPARDSALREHLDQAVRERLYLWQAEQSDVAAEPEIATLLEEVERDTLTGMVRRQHLEALGDAFDEGVLKELYTERAERYRTPRLVRLRILTRDFPQDRPDDWYAVYEELEDLAAAIRGGERDFAEAAQELSTDFSAPSGGEVGAIRAEAFAEWAGPAAQRAVLDLPTGGISEPLLIERYNSNRMTYERAGYMLVQLEAIEESRLQTFEEVRDKVVLDHIAQTGGNIGELVRQRILDSVSAEIYSENL